jgi:hypothetical protein
MMLWVITSAARRNCTKGGFHSNRGDLVTSGRPSFGLGVVDLVQRWVGPKRACFWAIQRTTRLALGPGKRQCRVHDRGRQGAPTG